MCIGKLVMISLNLYSVTQRKIKRMTLPFLNFYDHHKTKSGDIQLFFVPPGGGVSRLTWNLVIWHVTNEKQFSDFSYNGFLLCWRLKKNSKLRLGDVTTVNMNIVGVSCLGVRYVRPRSWLNSWLDWDRIHQENELNLNWEKCHWNESPKVR